MLSVMKSASGRKTKLAISFLLGLLTLAFAYHSSVKSINTESTAKPPALVNHNITDSFIIGSLHSGIDYNLSEINSLGLNLWHTYTSQGNFNGRNAPAGWTHWAANDSLNKDVSLYSAGIQGVLNNLSQNNLKAFMQRPKVEWLCFGQRSDYECEPANYVNADRFFYTFQQHLTGSPVADSGGYSMFCRVQNSTNNGPGWNSPGFVVKRLKCNTEQSQPSGGNNQWQGDSECDWQIKPRIRIDSTVAHNPQNLLVCNIKVIAQDLTILKNVDIHANDFLIDGGLFYNGRYIEEYPQGPNLTIHGNWGYLWDFRSRGDKYYNGNDPDSLNADNYRSRVDIQVYWYGNCDMWIDRIRVDNDVADRLFKGLDDPWIEQEASLVSGKSSALKFYIELSQFNNIPCISYVNKKLQSLGSNIDMVTDVTFHYALHVDWDDAWKVWNARHIKENYVDIINAKQIFMESYPLTSAYYPNPGINNTYSRIPNTLPTTNGGEILAVPIAPGAYDDWLQNNLDSAPYCLENQASGRITDYSRPVDTCHYTNNHPWQDIGNYRYVMKLGNEVSRRANIPFIYMQQAHHWFTPGEVRREPTNEEMNLLTNVAISYGAKGIVYYWFASHGSSICDYSHGIINSDNDPRDSNVYGQLKWNSLLAITSRLKTWGPAIMNFDNTQTNSYIYRLFEERNKMYQKNSYIFDVYTYKYGTGPYPCTEDYPEGDIPPNNTIGECKNERFVQVATFENAQFDENNYFMIVNRRCSPHREDIGEKGGMRQIKINFNHNSGELERYDNWNIYDIENPSARPVVYHKGDVYVNLGWFEPGQGKLYKMVPTIISGGELAGDEHISGESFTCEDTVFNNGYNITIDSGSTVSFIDSSCIVMTGGTFESGTLGSGSGQQVTYKGAGSSKWGGLRFNNTNVKIYNSKFQDISSPSVNYAVSMYNCPLTDIRGNEFVISTDTSGAVQSAYVSTLMGTGYSGLYINNNTVTMNNSRAPAIVVQGFAGLTLPAVIMNNTMTSGGYATGIMMTSITSATVKKNNISGFSTGVCFMGSTADMFGNDITNTSSVSQGVCVYGASVLNMAPSAMVYTGGYNVITNTYGSSKNIELRNSALLLDGGNNTFDISSAASPMSYHLYGSFFDDSYLSQYQGNCYKLDGTAITSGDPNQYLTAGNNQVIIKFADYICDASLPENLLVVSLGNNVNDTIPEASYGMGGGRSMTDSKSISRSKRSAAYTMNPKSLFDSIHVQMSRRDYVNAKTTCYNLINTYPDSMQSISSLQTLYLCTSATDTTYNGKLALKTFYESLILNHGSNVSLVKISNYLIQKCKVLLGEYTQALAGFQQIINNNPYSYEGLLARWDYMATSLLIQGQGGGISSIDNEQLTIDDNYDDDKSPYTKEQRNDIRKSINTAIEISKDESDKKIKTLEVSSDKGDENAKNELSKLRTLKQIIKTEKPKTVIEHIQIVSKDIKKVFGNDNINKSKTTNSIPTVFRLSQNYPNPFNPTTKINYDLPRDSKVNIVIYDILGREVKRLVNNEIKTAGAYIIYFNASNYASGVYFYRIEAEESNGSKFVDSKKMVLLK